jgi:hypothetical protein
MIARVILLVLSGLVAYALLGAWSILTVSPRPSRAHELADIAAAILIFGGVTALSTRLWLRSLLQPESAPLDTAGRPNKALQQTAASPIVPSVEVPDGRRC